MNSLRRWEMEKEQTNVKSDFQSAFIEQVLRECLQRTEQQISKKFKKTREFGGTFWSVAVRFTMLPQYYFE